MTEQKGINDEMLLTFSLKKLCEFLSKPEYKKFLTYIYKAINRIHQEVGIIENQDTQIDISFEKLSKYEFKELYKLLSLPAYNDVRNKIWIATIHLSLQDIFIADEKLKTEYRVFQFCLYELTKSELKNLTISELKKLLTDKTISYEYYKRIKSIIKEKEIADKSHERK
jgi:hypothetical protein